MLELQKRIRSDAMLFWLLFLFQYVGCNTDTVKRGTSSSLPLDVLMVSLKVNASTMTCGQAAIMPNFRMVRLNDLQMKELMQNKGGNYLSDYMAATEEEARENFPNLLMITDPSQDIYGNIPMSVYDNFMAKNILMEDLNRIKFYIINSTTANGRPEMGMYIINNTDTVNKMNGENYTTKNDNGHVLNNVTEKHDSNEPGTTQTTFTTYKATNSDVDLNVSKSSNVTNKDNKTSRDGSINNRDESTTRSTNFFTTNGSVDKHNSVGSSETNNILQTSGSTPPLGTSPGVNTVQTGTGDQLLSFGGTTIDPDVQKSLEELNKYLQGLGGGAQSDIRSVIQAVNTTLPPEQLLRLANGVNRMKRNADGSNTMENYCQVKGSLTDDNQYVHLCSSCAATTELTEDFFPRYINEVVCKTGDTDCFKIGQTVHGKCRQRYFTLNILRKSPSHCMTLMHNGDRLVMEDWQLVPKRIRVSCECTINKLSFLKPYVSQDAPVG